MTAIVSKDRRSGFGGKVHGFRADIGMGVLARRFRIFRQTRFKKTALSRKKSAWTALGGLRVPKTRAL